MSFSEYHTQDLSKLKILVTGGAGFIGSNLVKYLVQYNVGKVIILDNLATGSEKNVQHLFDEYNVTWIEGDICDLKTCLKATDGVDYVLHQAALGSVPRSIENPLATHETNSTGYLNVLEASKRNQVKRVVYASSSSVYGDSKELPKQEDNFGVPLSPYAVSKYSNELYGRVFYDVYGLQTIGLRYFNIYGPNQRPGGPYAAAIPIFIDHVLRGKAPFINGDGLQTRDFTYIDNAVQANIKALFTDKEEALGKTMNIAVGERISIIDLYNAICKEVGQEIAPNFRESRAGDVRDSLADISRAKDLLGYEPDVRVEEGLRKTIDWFKQGVIV